jgi:outer membrane protein OmpA-like peptidoglycan-associated protein
MKTPTTTRSSKHVQTKPLIAAARARPCRLRKMRAKSRSRRLTKTQGLQNSRQRADAQARRRPRPQATLLKQKGEAQMRQCGNNATAAANAQANGADADGGKGPGGHGQQARRASAAAVTAAQADADQARLIGTAGARQGEHQADSDKAAMRAQLSEQLNKILETRDSARGLIVSMSDVLFDTGRYSLKPGAREKLAKVAGILIAYPGLNIAVGGYTDNVGGDEMNQKLSENRARPFAITWCRRAYLPTVSVSATGIRQLFTVASNDNSSRPAGKPESGAARIGRRNWKPGQCDDWKLELTRTQCPLRPQSAAGDLNRAGGAPNGPDQENRR